MAGVMKTHKRLSVALGVTPETLSRLLKENPRLDVAVSLGDDLVNGKVIQTLADIAEKGDIGAIKYWLNNRVLNEWADRSKQEIEAKISTLDKLVDTLENTYEPIKESTEPIEQKS